jgi:hypothetical protein
VATGLQQHGPALLLSVERLCVHQLELLRVDVVAVPSRPDEGDDAFRVDRESLTAIELAAVSALPTVRQP